MLNEDRPLLGAVLVALVVVAVEIPLATYAMDANWLSAWSNFGILLATLLVVAFTGQQLVGISRTQREAKNDQRKWATLQACDRYDSDQFIQEAIKELNLADSKMDEKLHDIYVTRLLNYFSSIAIGLDQDFYDDAIARRHLGYIVVGWFNSIVTRHRYPPEETRQNFPDLAKLVDRWAPLIDMEVASATASPLGTVPKEAAQ